VPIRRQYEPNPANRALYDELSARFVETYRRVRPLFQSLNRQEAQA
jgi:hypothetical protein